MKNAISNYFLNLKDVFDEVIVSDISGSSYELDEAIGISINMITNARELGKKLLFIGNGASASIASHMAVDFWKNAGIKAQAFNDSSLLTCVSNDYGYSHVFEKPIEMFAESRDILIAISSSGQSENILQAAYLAKERGVKIITLSGFKKNNPLKKLGDLNFYVPVKHYGYVEIVHLSICHCMVDMIIKNRTRLTKRA